MAHGGQMGGEYLESLGKTDLAQAQRRRSGDTLIEMRGHRLLRHLRELAGQDRDRLDGMTEGVPF